MANKRIFKKYVTQVSTALVNDMMTIYYSFENIDKDAIDKAVINILKGGESAIMKSNVKFDKTLKAFENSRQYRKAKRDFYNGVYKKVNGEFKKCISDSIATFNNAIPEDLKNKLKAEVSD